MRGTGPRFLMALMLGNLAASADGQACAGFPDFTRGPVQLGAAVDWSDHATAVSGGALFGGSDAFGRVALGRAWIDGRDGSAFLLGGAVGFPLRLVGGVSFLCPTMSIGAVLGSTLDIGDGGESFDMTEATLAAGVSVGAAVSHADDVHIIPFASLGFAHAEVTGTRNSADSPYLSRSDGFWMVGGGAVFVFNEAIGVRLAFAAPLGVDANVPTVSVASIFAVGRKR